MYNTQKYNGKIGKAMKDYTGKIEEVKKFINDKIIITKNDYDYVLCSDIDILSINTEIIRYHKLSGY